MEAEVKGVGETIKTKGTSLLASLGPYAGALSMLRRMRTKKGAVSNCFVSVLRCQRGLNSSLWSSDSAAKGGQRRTEAKQLDTAPFFEMHPSKHRECSRIRTQGGREAGTFRFYLWYVLAGEGRKEWERSMYYLGRG